MYRYDDQLWRELEYLISDMNCFSTHLLQYFVAKLVDAEKRCFVHNGDISTRKDRIVRLLIALGLYEIPDILDFLSSFTCSSIEHSAGEFDSTIELTTSLDELQQTYSGGIFTEAQGRRIREHFSGKCEVI